MLRESDMAHLLRTHPIISVIVAVTIGLAVFFVLATVRPGSDNHVGASMATATASAVPVGAAAGGSTATAPVGIVVIKNSDNSQPIGTYATVSEALSAASQVAGFQVLPVRNLPAGLSVTGIDVRRPDFGPTFPISPRNFGVQIFIRGDSGGLLITEDNGPITNPGEGGTKIGTTTAGNVYAYSSGDGRSYQLPTSEKTFSIITHGGLTDAQALAIMDGFH